MPYRLTKKCVYLFNKHVLRVLFFSSSIAFTTSKNQTDRKAYETEETWLLKTAKLMVKEDSKNDYEENNTNKINCQQWKALNNYAYF